MKSTRWWLAGLALFLGGCAMVTVNVYFPEEDVKNTYEQMADKYMNRPAEATDTVPVQGALPARPAAEWSLVSPAEAEGVSSNTEEMMREMEQDTDVVKAYRTRGQRDPAVRALLAEAVLGLTGDGLVALLPAEQRNPEAAVAAKAILLRAVPSLAPDSAPAARVNAWLNDLIAKENADRTTIINGMGRAQLNIVVRNSNQEAVGDQRALLASLTRQSRKLFGDQERENAPYGWWLQAPDASWVQKQAPVVDLDSETE